MANVEKHKHSDYILTPLNEITENILEMLNEISVSLTPHTLFNSGVMLGRLMQIIIANKNEE